MTITIGKKNEIFRKNKNIIRKNDENNDKNIQINIINFS